MRCKATSLFDRRVGLGHSCHEFLGVLGEPSPYRTNQSINLSISVNQEALRESDSNHVHTRADILGTPALRAETTTTTPTTPRPPHPSI